jgi:hypothetical protein
MHGFVLCHLTCYSTESVLINVIYMAEAECVGNDAKSIPCMDECMRHPINRVAGFFDFINKLWLASIGADSPHDTCGFMRATG